MQTGVVCDDLACDPGQLYLFVHSGQSELYSTNLTTSLQLDEQPS